MKTYLIIMTMIITTTNSVEGTKIVKYLGLVTSNLVLGTNIFADMKAEFTDLFGGFSKTYNRKFELLYQSAYEALAYKARLLGANGVVGVKVDFDEMGGDVKQMLMISVSGTAVRLDTIEDELNKPEVSKVSATQLAIEMYKRKWEHATWTTDFVREKDIDFIVEHALWELMPYLYDYYVQDNAGVIRDIDKRFPDIVAMLDYEQAVSFIYNDYGNRHIRAFPLIKDCNLFSATKVLEILEEGKISLAVNLLSAEKSEYTKDDLRIMKEIVSIVDNLPDVGAVAEVKGGLLSSKMEEKYICPNGHKNDKEEVYCMNYDCGLNIKGLTKLQVDIVEAFKIKVGVLSKLLS